MPALERGWEAPRAGPPGLVGGPWQGHPRSEARGEVTEWLKVLAC